MQSLIPSTEHGLDPASWHETIAPGILYVGTPVVLHTTENPDGSANLAPMSSLWFLGWGAMVGMSTGSQTALESVHPIAEDNEAQRGGTIAAELRVQRVHFHRYLRMPGHRNRIDPDRWRPLIMSFQQFYGVGDRVHSSRLASISEDFYRGPDIDRVHRAAAANG